LNAATLRAADIGPLVDRVRADIFRFVMADALVAGNEQHGAGALRSQMNGIVTGTAHHVLLAVAHCLPAWRNAATQLSSKCTAGLYQRWRRQPDTAGRAMACRLSLQ
jgi:hypothetical protein